MARSPTHNTFSFRTAPGSCWAFQLRPDGTRGVALLRQGKILPLELHPALTEPLLLVGGLELSVTFPRGMEREILTWFRAWLSAVRASGDLLDAKICDCLAQWTDAYLEPEARKTDPEAGREHVGRPAETAKVAEPIAAPTSPTGPTKRDLLRAFVEGIDQYVKDELFRPPSSEAASDPIGLERRRGSAALIVIREAIVRAAARRLGLISEDYEVSYPINLDSIALEPSAGRGVTVARGATIRGSAQASLAESSEPADEYVSARDLLEPEDPVHQDPDGLWYFWLDTPHCSARIGPFRTEETARADQARYLEWVASGGLDEAEAARSAARGEISRAVEDLARDIEDGMRRRGYPGYFQPKKSSPLAPPSAARGQERIPPRSTSTAATPTTVEASAGPLAPPASPADALLSKLGIPAS
jgi:hypothetical protein